MNDGQETGILGVTEHNEKYFPDESYTFTHPVEVRKVVCRVLGGQITQFILEGKFNEELIAIKGTD